MKVVLVTRAGGHPQGLVLGMMCATGFVSMWVQNTSTTLIMIPVAMSVATIVAPDTGTPDRNAANFGKAIVLCIAYAATIGGLGLTGVIVWAELQLVRVAGACMDIETIRFANLAGFFQLTDESDAAFAYTVAWVDCASRGRALGRGIFTRSNHSSENRPEVGTSAVCRFGPVSTDERTWKRRISHQVLADRAKHMPSRCDLLRRQSAKAALSRL